MAISKSNFFIISTILLAVLFLFQFSNISARYVSQATKNEAVNESFTKLDKNSAIETGTLMDEESYSTAIIGETENNEVKLVMEWCTYLKRTWCHYDSLTKFKANLSKQCKLLVINSTVIKQDNDISILQESASNGIRIIMTTLPDVEIIRSSKTLQRLLGIKMMGIDPIDVQSLTFFDGFLLGGKTTYKNIHRTVPYYYLSSGTKTYVVGGIKKQKKLKIKNEDLPPIVWRNQYESSFVFAVNWNFFTDHTGLGMLTAMLSDTEEYFIYPIINAQSVICQNYPYLSNENSDVTAEKYYHTSSALARNVLWPDIVSILGATNDRFTGMIAPKFKYSDTENAIYREAVNYFYTNNEKISGELGISGDQLEGNDYYSKKISYDSKSLSEMLPDYTFTLFAPGDMLDDTYNEYIGEPGNILSDVRTIILDKERFGKPLISYYNENILMMMNTIDGFSHKDMEDIYMRSLQTALGYSSVELDFKRVFYPETNNDDWTQLSKNLSSYLETYWRIYRGHFEQVTASRADEKARRFLALEYTSFRRRNTLNLIIDNFEKEASFLLILTGENIESISGGTFTELENDRYVINADKTSVVIKLKSKSAITE